MPKGRLAAGLAFALAVLGPALPAAEVVPDTKPFEIVRPIEGWARYGNFSDYYYQAATVTSLGAQGYAVGWETYVYHCCDYDIAGFSSGLRLLADGRNAESFDPTTWLDLEDGWAQELSFANLGRGRFVSVASASAYDEFLVFFRRFAAGRKPIDPESVDLGAASSASEPHVAANGGGLFVITWNAIFDDESVQKMAQVFGADGQPVTAAIAVTGRVSVPGALWNYGWTEPLVGMDADGNFVVLSTDGGTWGQRFDRTGRPLGERFWIGGADPLAMVMAPTGEFVVAWRAPVQPGVMLLSRFTADGRRTGPLVRLAWSLTTPAMALDRSGRVALFWIDARHQLSLAVFDSSLALIGPVIHASGASPDTYERMHGGVAFGDDGRILTVWLGRCWGRHRAQDSVIGRFWKVRSN